MTRKDYEAIAEVLRWVRSHPTLPNAADVIDIAADELADYLVATNPRFDRIRFLKACGYEGVSA